MQTSKENADFVSTEVFIKISKINKGLVAAIRKSIKAIEDKMRQIIQSDTELHQQTALLKSMPGIGEQTSLYLIIATKACKAVQPGESLPAIRVLHPLNTVPAQASKEGLK